MKPRSLLILTVAATLLCVGVRAAIPPVWPPPPPCIDPPFCPYFPSYQGFLTERGVPADGLYDIITSIYDAPTGGHLIGPPTTNRNVQVQRGLFTIHVRVPAGLSGLPPIEGDDTWWIEHCIQHPEDPICQVIEPRQRIAPTVQSLYATLAASVRDGAVTAAKLAPGAVGHVALGDGSVSAGKISDGAVVRSLNGVREDVTLSAGPGLALHALGPNLAFELVRSCDDYDDCYWALLGNAGTVDGVNFLGTTDPVPLNLRVNSLRVMRYEYPAGSASPKLIGGYGGNIVSAIGGTISGGGKLTGINKVLGDYGTVGGGFTNVIEFAPSGTIGGGDGNTIRNEVVSGTIGGGSGHSLDGISYWPTISGGLVNHVKGFSEANTIGGGEANTIEEGTSYSTIGGGGVNNVAAANTTISGGSRNEVQFLALAGTIGGGERNVIRSNSWFATIGGGDRNFLAATGGTIGGGVSNTVGTVATHATIGGGATNLALNAFSTISGGTRCRASGRLATVAGGEANTVSATHATVSGGSLNSATGDFATVPGGARAVASHYGQVAHGSGAFASNGDAQGSFFVARTNTSPAAPQGELFLDGLSRRMTIPVGSSWSFDVLITARSTVGTSAGYQIRGVIENDGGVTTLLLAPVAPPLKVILGEDVAAWDANVEADNANDALVIKVLGDSQSVIRWVAHVRTVEVSNP